MKKQLEVGDKITRISLNKIEHEYTVESVSKTQVKCGTHTRFMRKINAEGWVTPVGSYLSRTLYKFKES